MQKTISTAAEAALDDLLEVSPEMSIALIADGDCNVLASTLKGSTGKAASKRLATLVNRIVDEAERSRVELGRDPVTQLEIATGNEHVFVVGNDDYVVAAVTGKQPTVGLVFYDLKSALRKIRDEAEQSQDDAENGTKVVVEEIEPEAANSSDEAKSGRLFKKNKKGATK